MESNEQIQRKLEELRTHVPFINKMITKWTHGVSSNSNPKMEKHLQRLKGLQSFLTNPVTKKCLPKMETLQRMEAVLQNIKDRVQRTLPKPAAGPESKAIESTTIASASSQSTSGHHTTSSSRQGAPLERSTSRESSMSWESSTSQKSVHGHGSGLSSTVASSHGSSSGHGHSSKSYQGSDNASQNLIKSQRHDSGRSNSSSMDRNSSSTDRRDSKFDRPKEMYSKMGDQKKYSDSRKEMERIQVADQRKLLERSRSDVGGDSRKHSSLEMDRSRSIGSSSEREREKNLEMDRSRSVGSSSDREREKNREVFRSRPPESGLSHRTPHQLKPSPSSVEVVRIDEGKKKITSSLISPEVIRIKDSPSRSISSPEIIRINDNKKKSNLLSSPEVIRIDESKQTAKRNSLLDLPMPPSAPSQGSKERFDTSREKLQKILGIKGDSLKASKPAEQRSSGPASESVLESGSNWRNELRARMKSDLGSSSVSPHSHDDRKDHAHLSRPRSSPVTDETSRRNLHQPSGTKSQGSISSSYADRDRNKRQSSSFMGGSHSSNSQPSKIIESRCPPPPPVDSPMSPSPASPVQDTPMSPDQEASFSPVLDGEDASPVKTIPLQNLQEKGVDLEAIKKALAQIQSNEKAKTGSGHSYRYEDFVGPAAKDDEPYDPEEVWQSVDSESSGRHTAMTGSSSSMMSSSRDVDLRQVPQAFPHRSQDRHSSHQGVRDIDSRKDILANVSQIPLPQRQSMLPPSTPQSGMHSSMYDQDIRSQRAVDPRGSRGNSGDVDMRYPQYRHQLPPPQQQHPYSSTALPHQRHGPVPLAHTSLPPRQPPLPPPPPLPAVPPPPLPVSPLPSQPPLPREPPPPKMTESTERGPRKDPTPSRLDHIRSKIAQNAGELIRPGQRGVAISQMEKYKMKRQTSTGSEIKSPPHSSPSYGKDPLSKRSEFQAKNQNSLTVLDTLLPEDTLDNDEAGNQPSRDPRKPPVDSTSARDPRLLSPDSQSTRETDSSVKDPRLSSDLGIGADRTSKSQPIRDPRQDLGKYSNIAKDKRSETSVTSSVEGLNRDSRDPRQSSVPSDTQLRDPRKDSSSGHHQEHSLEYNAPSKDPRKDLGSVNKDPRKEHSSVSQDPRKELSSSMKDPRKDIGLVNKDPRKEFSTAAKDPRQDHVPPIVDPRHEMGTMSRDPRQDYGSASRLPPRQDPGNMNREPWQDHAPPLSRDPRHDLGHMHRDPRQEHTSMSRDPRHDHSSMKRDPRQEFGGVSRDPWQDQGNFMGRDGRMEMGSYGATPGIRDPRREVGPYASMTGTHASMTGTHASLTGTHTSMTGTHASMTGTHASITGPQHRDPRFVPRPERPPANVWPPGSQTMSSTSFRTPPPSVPASSSAAGIMREINESDPSRSASGSLIGQSFTCLMMRGLPPFAHSHHIYRFFEEYLLRDISLEVDLHYNCKGTAYVHFPSHNSAREALEKMNGYLLHGSPISLRICAVGILRQAKNAYEQMNRDREARLGLPERPRGNANPFYKPRPKEPPPPPPPAPRPVAAKPPTDRKDPLQEESVSKDKDKTDSGVESSAYSSLCGVKVPPSGSSLKFKIPKIRKEEPKKNKRSEEKAGSSSTKKLQDTSKGKSAKEERKAETKTEKKMETKEKKSNEKYLSKARVSDSSDSDFGMPVLSSPMKKNKRRVKKMVIESDSDSEPEPAKSLPDAGDRTADSSESEDDSDDCMVIDESVHSDGDDDGTVSELSSVLSDEPSEQLFEKKKGVKKQQVKKTKTKAAPKKVKESQKAAKPIKPKKPKIIKAAARKTKKKKGSKKYSDGIYKDDLDLQSGVGGMKLTRHTQGELEELIPQQYKLKVIVPVPHRYVETLNEDDKAKGKKRNVKKRIIEIPLSPVTEVKDVEEVEVEVDVVPEISQEEISLDKEDVDIVEKKPVVKKKVETRRKAVPKKKVETKKPKLKKIKPPGSTRGIIPPVLGDLAKEPTYITPTVRKGSKRKCPGSPFERKWKRARRTTYNLSLSSWMSLILNQSTSSQDVPDLDSSVKSLETKRELTSPGRTTPAKKPRLDYESESTAGTEQLTREDTTSLSQSNLDLYDNSNMADEVSDVTHLTPSLLEVEPTICNALPDASVLANVLSPPHAATQSNDNSISSVSELAEEGGAASKLPPGNRSAPSKPTSDSCLSKSGVSVEKDAKEIQKHENESKVQGNVKDKLSFDKENDDEILTETVCQLVESLDKSLNEETGTEDPTSLSGNVLADKTDESNDGEKVEVKPQENADKKMKAEAVLGGDSQEKPDKGESAETLVIEEKLDDGKEKLDDGKEKLDDGKEKLDDGKEKLDDVKEKLDDVKEKLDDVKEKLDDVKEKLDDGKEKSDDGKEKSVDGKEKLDDGKEKLDDVKEKLDDGKEALKNPAESTVERSLKENEKTTPSMMEELTSAVDDAQGEAEAVCGSAKSEKETKKVKAIQDTLHDREQKTGDAGRKKVMDSTQQTKNESETGDAGRKKGMDSTPKKKNESEMGDAGKKKGMDSTQKKKNESETEDAGRKKGVDSTQQTKNESETGDAGRKKGMDSTQKKKNERDKEEEACVSENNQSVKENKLKSKKSVMDIEEPKIGESKETPVQVLGKTVQEAKDVDVSAVSKEGQDSSSEQASASSSVSKICEELSSKGSNSVSESLPVQEPNIKKSSIEMQEKIDPVVEKTRRNDIPMLNDEKKVGKDSDSTKKDGLHTPGHSKSENNLDLGSSDSAKMDFEEADDGDDSISIGRMSTSSFVDDASQVSSEGRELKTPDSVVSKRGKKPKSSTPVLPPECRRVTRGSLVEPRVTEVAEWDDGGVVDLYQCDLCEYVGRHVASHLTNFHSERELQCEFKKEDFGPVIRDHVGPSEKSSEDEGPPIKLSLSWIPKAMSFNKSVTCKKCDYFSNSRFDLIYHYLEHNPKSAEVTYHCRLCNYMSEVMEEFYDHMSSHTGEYRYMCDLCGHKTYKKSLLEDHHKSSHRTQSPKFSISGMIEEDGWLYIHVCKICMFVRIGLHAAEQHVQHRHGGKADIHKANMSRTIVLHSALHSEIKKAGEGEGTSQPRPRYTKGKKKKKAKKGPDLQVFVGGEDEEKEIEEEMEVKAKELVDRIATNMHTTTSAQQVQKRMSLLNTIFQKLDETEVEESESPANDSSDVTKEGSCKTRDASLDSKKSEDMDGSAEIGNGDDADKDVDSLPSLGFKETKKILVDRGDGDGKQSGVPDEKKVNASKELETNVPPESKEAEPDSSDSESTVSALDTNVFDEEQMEQMAMGSGALHDTIRKLSAQLDQVAKEKADLEKQEESERQQKAKAAAEARQRDSIDDDDSDSDNLVICEDEDTDAKDGESQPQDGESSAHGASSLKTSGTVDTPSPTKMPKLRIRPASQLIDPRFRVVPKAEQFGKKTTNFVCCVPDCNFSSDSHSDVLKHIIHIHGPFKCIASGCHFVCRSKAMYTYHMRKFHQNLNFLVCPFLCKVSFSGFQELLEHLNSHQNADSLDASLNITQDEDEDHEEPGFLRIESVGTLDPASASQMFGDDFDGSTATSSGAPSQQFSPIKITLGMSKNGADGTPTINFNQSNLLSAGLPTSQVWGTPLGGQKTLAPPGHMATGSANKGSESPVTATHLGSSKTSSSSGSAEVPKGKSKLGAPQEGDGEQVEQQRANKQPPAPGLATLPKSPPTVPIQDVFKEYQPIDIFKILTTKLAPEVFKCMHNGCVYADDEPDSFKNHVSSHGGDIRCCYCLVLMPTPDALVEHVLTEHSHCEFQCKYCLYRAFTKIYMGVHLKNFHPYDEPRYIKVGTIRTGYPPSPPIDQFVRPYRCNYQECPYRTVDSEAFRMHVQQTHGPFVILSCDFCHKHLHVIPLIEHMREHQMDSHQCPYCLHGDSERERLLGHLLNCHSGRNGKVLLRKHQEERSPDLTPKADGHSTPPQPPPPPPAPPSKISPEKRGNLSAVGSPRRKGEEGPPVSSSSSSPGKDSNPSQLEGRRMSRSLSRELGDTDITASKSTGLISDDTSGQPAEKTGLSGHALYRCGNDGCEYTSLNQVMLREHLQVCDLSLDSTTKCYHCGKQCRHLSTLFDHLRVHGPKRYCCGVTGCDYRATMAHYFKNHMKQNHHCAGFKHLIKDPKNKDPETQEYVVYPKDALLPIKAAKKRKHEYAYDDIDRVPRAHISYQDLKCYHCLFQSKVRLNLIKHLRLHEKYPEGIPERLYISGGISSPIPFKQPVNPVPCLDRKELMFDKMMNLAGSSFDTKKKKEDDLRAKHPIPPAELERLPKFVSEERLHSCGVKNCNYVSCDDMMLKYHIRSLHTDMTSFPCPHCVDLPITIEKMTAHFKLHGDRLYRCGWCQYVSARRNIVDRHMKEKHHGKKVFDFVIREPHDPDAVKKDEEQAMEQETASPVQPTPPPPPPPPPEPPQWQCGLCRFSSVTQQEMVNHTSFKHSIKSQYKCGYCRVRSSVRTSFDAHFASKHPNQAFRVLCMYYRLDSEDIEPLNQGDGQNTHEPIWRRNDPERIRHIRGIMLDDPEVKKSWFKNTSTGAPVKGEFVCPVCGSFKTTCMSTFRSHLCREANYDRYQCVECGVSNALLPNLQRHYIKMHRASFTQDCYLNLPLEEDKEVWVGNIISHQQLLIKQWHDKVGNDQDFVPGGHQASPSKSAAASRLSSSQTVPIPASEGTPQQGGVVLHDSGSERGRFLCDVCGCECRTAAGLKSHTTAMHQTRFKCHYCPFASNSEDAVKQHCSLKHPKLQNEVLDVSQRLKTHKDEGLLGDPELPGVVSNQDMSEAEGTEVGKASVDEANVSDNVKTYACQYCSFSTNVQSSLNAHNRTKHVDTRMFRCNHCNSRFGTTNDALRHHKWKHQQLKPNIVFLEKIDGAVTAKPSEDENLDSSFTLPALESTSMKSPRHVAGQDLPKKTRNKTPVQSRSSSPVPKAESSSSLVSSMENVHSLPMAKGASSESQVTYSCCHCNHRSSKGVMEDHMKKQHRDMPYQVRKEEADKVFTEVYIYKCIHCIVESISHAQSMDHWIHNHAMLEFKYQMVLRHSGEVSNQVVTSTTADKNPVEPSDAYSEKVSVGDAGGIASDAESTNEPSSSMVITSSSEGVSTSVGNPLPIGKRRSSNVDIMSPPHRYSIDTEDEDQSEIGDNMDDEEDHGVHSSSDVESQDMMYKCGYCKKSSSKYGEIEAHMNKVHSERPMTVKKLKRDIFDQLYRAEYECGYCGEKGRNTKMVKHHKIAHPNLPTQFNRVPQAPRANICYRCEVCAHVVKNLTSIRSHLRRHHPEANKYTFKKISFGSPMRFPIKQPYKCNYCGDVGETLQEMENHHAFLHSHLELSIKNLRDEALSSVHTPSTSTGSGDVPAVSSMPAPAPSSSSSVPQPGGASKTTVRSADAMPGIKNTARKSFPNPIKRPVALKSTARAYSSMSPSSSDYQEGGSSQEMTEVPQELIDIYARVDLGGGIPVKLTYRKLGELINLQPQVVIKRLNSSENT